jgi:hypothetical protein
MGINEENSKTLTLPGLIVSGRGVGAGMVEANQDVICDILGATPYPGTLNVVLDAPLLLKKAHQLDAKGKLFGVQGFINGVSCLMYRFHGAPLHVVEVISSVHLRNTLELKDDQAIEVVLPQENTATPSPQRRRLWELFYGRRLQAYYDDHMHKVFMSRGIRFFHKKACQSKKEFV